MSARFLGSGERWQESVGERASGGHFAKTEKRDADGQRVAGARGEATGEGCFSLKHTLASLLGVKHTETN